MRTVLIVLAVLFTLGLLKRLGSYLIGRIGPAYMLTTRTCSGGCLIAGAATHLLTSANGDDGVPVCLPCVRKRGGAPVEWLLEKGYLTPLPAKNDDVVT